MLIKVYLRYKVLELIRTMIVHRGCSVDGSSSITITGLVHITLTRA